MVLCHLQDASESWEDDAVDKVISVFIYLFIYIFFMVHKVIMCIVFFGGTLIIGLHF